MHLPNSNGKPKLIAYASKRLPEAAKDYSITELEMCGLAINITTLSSTYNEKKYAVILLHFRWLFIKGNVFINEWGIFGVEIFLHYSQFFVKGNFAIGRVECSFANLLLKVDSDAVVDHLALTHIMRSKVEPATTRIKKLLEVLSSYSFNLYYIKGKDMILSDFLSRQRVVDSDPHEIIPISFSMRNVLQERYYNL